MGGRRGTEGGGGLEREERKGEGGREIGVEREVGTKGRRGMRCCGIEKREKKNEREKEEIVNGNK